MEGSRTAQNRRYAVLVSALAAAALFFTASIPPTAPPADADVSRASSPYGMMVHPLWNDHTWIDVESELEAMAAAGARWVRVDVGWPSMQSGRGRALDSYHLNRLRAISAAARSRGMELQVCLVGTPAWANGGRGFWYPPTWYADFEAYVYKLVSAAKGSVKYWEISTEPNLKRYLPPDADPVRYSKLLQKAYHAAKRADPGARIISGGIWTNDTAYLRKLYANGAGGHFDSLGLHPYTDDRSPYAGQQDPESDDDSRWNFRGIANMRAVMIEKGDSSKSIWITETGWTTSGCNWSVSQANQARYVGEAYKRLHEEFPYVETLIIYNLRDNTSNPSIAGDNFGVVRHDYTPKPAYDSYAASSMSWWPQPLIGARRPVATYGSSTTVDLRLPPLWGPTQVVIEQKSPAATSWSEITSTVTSGDNTVRAAVRPTRHTLFRATLPGRLLTSRIVTVKVLPRIWFASAASRVPRLRYVRLHGKLLRSPGSTMSIQRKVGTWWETIARPVIRADGTFRTYVNHRARGSYYYRARFRGTSTLLGAYTRSFVVVVY